MDIYDPIAEALGVSTIDFIPDYSEYGVNYIALGGIPPWNKGMRGVVKQSEEVKTERSAKMKGIPPACTQKEDYVPWNKGKTGAQTHSIETKAKMRVSAEGKPKTEAHKANLSAANKGKSPPNKGKPMSEEQKEKRRAAKRRNDLLRATSRSEA